MGIFQSDMPKGITKDEFALVRGELLSAPFGSEAKLTAQQVDAIMDMLAVAADHPDTYAEHEHNIAEVDSGEAQMIESRIVGKAGLTFSPAQRAHVHTVLTKYVSQNIVHHTLGLF